MVDFVKWFLYNTKNTIAVFYPCNLWIFMKIIYRYTIKEFIPKFILSLFIFTSILLMDRIFDLIDLLINKNAGLKNIISVLLNILPSLFMFTIPMSILAASILLFTRLLKDNEIMVFYGASHMIGIEKFLLENGFSYESQKKFEVFKISRS